MSYTKTTQTHQHSSKKALLAAAVASLSVAPIAAYAQEGVDQEAKRVIEEITVTATKRETSLQDTPLSIGLVSGDFLEDSGILNALDAAQEVIGVVVQLEDEQRTARVTIRGVGSSQTGIAIEPSVGVLVDNEVYARTPAAVSNFLLDVQRVEVLRGPQGTLFGRNTSAGAIHTISKRPSMDAFESSVVLGVEERGEYRAKGVISGPMSDSAGYRFNAYYQNRDGHINNIVPGADYDITGSESFGGRLQLQFDVSENASILLRADHEESEGLPGAQVFEDLAASNIVRGVMEDFGVAINGRNQSAGLDRTAFRDTENTGVSAELNMDIGEYTFRSMTFRRDWRLDENRDSTFSPIIAGTSAFGGFVDTETFQQEFHLISPTTETYDFLLGAFYYNADVSRDATNNRCTTLPNPAFEFDPVSFEVINCPFAANGVANLINGNSTRAETENYALFGELNYRPMEKLNLIFGGRYTVEDTDFSYLGGSNDINDNGDPVKVASSDSEFTYKLGAQYYWTEDLNTYVTYATGFKGAAFNSTINANEEDLRSPARPETSEQFEVGLRSQWFDRRLTVNVTYFDTSFEGFQERFVEATEDPVTGITEFQDRLLNTDDLTSRGVEIETSVVLPIEGLSADFSAAFIDAEFGDNPGIFTGCPVPFIGTDDCVQVDGSGPFRLPITGRDLPRSPDEQYIARINYDTTLGADFGFRGTLSYKWVDGFSPDIQQRPQWAIPQQDVLDMTASITSPTGRYTLTIFGRNLLDDRRYLRIFTPGGAQGGAAGSEPGTFGRTAILPKDFERYFGANLKIRF